MKYLWWLPFLAGCKFAEGAGEFVRDLPRTPGVLSVVDAFTGGVGGPVLEGLAAVAGLLVGGKAVHVAAKKTKAVYDRRKAKGTA